MLNTNVAALSNVVKHPVPLFNGCGVYDQRLHTLCSRLSHTNSDSSEQHVLLELWNTLKQSQPNQEEELARAYANLDIKLWRSIARLLFVSDPQIIQVLIAVMNGLTSSSHQWWWPVHTRIWGSSWLVQILEKIEDIHSNLIVEDERQCQWQVKASLQLLSILHRTLHNISFTRDAFDFTKDQVRYINVVCSLSLSPSEFIAIQATRTLHDLVHNSSLLNKDAFTYLLGCIETFTLHMVWLNRSWLLPESPVITVRQREVLVLLTSVTIQNQVLVATSSDLVDLLLQSINHRDSQVVSSMLELEAVSLQCPQAPNLARALRLSPALLSLSWRLGHTVSTVRTGVRRVLEAIVTQSPPADVFRAIIEQGCVLVWYVIATTELDPEQQNPTDSLATRQLLRFVVRRLESLECSDSFMATLLASLIRSTNTLLQRNVLITLLLLQQSSEVLRGTLVLDEDSPGRLIDAVSSAISMSDMSNQCNVVAPIVIILLKFCDKSSMLKIGTRRSRLGVDRGRPMPPSPAPVAPEVIVRFLCADNDIVEIPLTTTLIQTCKVIERRALDPHRTIVISLDVLAVSRRVVDSFLAIQTLKPSEAHSYLLSLTLTDLIALLSLAKLTECTKAWHSATLVLTQSQLNETNWFDIWNAAVNVRHPALMQRALRIMVAKICLSTHAVQPSLEHVQSVILELWSQLQ